GDRPTEVRGRLGRDGALGEGRVRVGAGRRGEAVELVEAVEVRGEGGGLGEPAVVVGLPPGVQLGQGGGEHIQRARLGGGQVVGGHGESNKNPPTDSPGAALARKNTEKAGRWILFFLLRIFSVPAQLRGNPWASLLQNPWAFVPSPITACSF